MTQTDAGKLADELAQYCARKEFTQHEEQMFADILDALRTPPTGNATVDVTGLSDVVVEDIRSHIRGSLDGAATYDYELGSGWRCFHCGEMFRTHGGAALHFGKPADKAACLAQLQERGEDEQPVAWRWHYKLESDRWFYQPFKPGLSQLSQKWEVEIEPLYTSPPQAVAAGREAIAAQTFAKDCDLLTYLNGKAIDNDGRVKLDISFNELKQLRSALALHASVEEVREAVQPKVVDNDAGEIAVILNDKELRGWSYANDGERRIKMLAAREYVEGWCDGRQS